MSTETENDDRTTDREQNDERDEWHYRADLRQALAEAYGRLEYVNNETPEEYDMGAALDDVLQAMRDMDTSVFQEEHKIFKERAGELRDDVRGE